MVGEPVLVVDDDPIVLRTLARTLKRFGASCVTSESASEARALASAPDFRPRAFLLDAGLPEGALAGVDLLAWLRVTWPRVPAAVLTGNVDAALRERARTLDAFYLVKPADSLEVSAFVERFAPGRTRLDERLIEEACSRYGLTPGEVAVVLSVARRQSVDEFCAERGITPRAYRHHAGNIARKTGQSVKDLVLGILAGRE